MNQLGLAPMRIPKMRKSWMEPPPNTRTRVYGGLRWLTWTSSSTTSSTWTACSSTRRTPLPGAEEFLGAIRASAASRSWS